jgi:hypothetical protein
MTELTHGSSESGADLKYHRRPILLEGTSSFFSSQGWRHWSRNMEEGHIWTINTVIL